MRPSQRSRTPFRWSILLPALAIISGCTKTPDLAGIGEAFNIIGPDRDLVVALRAGETPIHWHLKGKPGTNALSVSEAKHVPGLNVRAGSSDFWFARELHASLLATPYLSWSWFSNPPSAGQHPVRLVIGFADQDAPRKAAWWSVMSSNFPRADRIVAIEWAETALGRGTVIGPTISPDNYSYARYIARGGTEHGNRWWTDNVDLSLLHQQLWPRHSVKNTEIRFIGVWSSTTRQSANMYLANLRLFR